jgi:uncharacterized protein
MAEFLVKRSSQMHGTGIFTLKTIKEGDSFYKIPTEKTLSHNTPHSAQIARGVYVWDFDVLNYVNHSCNPNCRIDIPSMSLIATRDIAFNEELTCDYDLTEEKGVPFVCACKSPQCKGTIGKNEAL